MGYQTVGAQMAAFHSQFASLLNGGVAQYLSAEIANAQQALAGSGTHLTPALSVNMSPTSSPTPSAPPPPSPLLGVSVG